MNGRRGHISRGNEHDRDVRFQLRDVSFEGEGLTPEFAEASWQRIHDAIYEGQGA